MPVGPLRRVMRTHRRAVRRTAWIAGTLIVLLVLWGNGIHNIGSSSYAANDSCTPLDAQPDPDPPQLPDTPRDELRVLRTEVENQDFFHICYIQYLVFDRRLHASACTGNSGPEFSPVRPCTEICAQRVRRCLRKVGSSAVRRSLRCISARCCSWGPRA